METNPRKIARDWGLHQDWRRMAILVLGSYVLALALYNWSPLSPPLEVYGAKQAHLPIAVGREFKYVSAREAARLQAEQAEQTSVLDVRNREDFLLRRAEAAQSLPAHEAGTLIGKMNKAAQQEPLILYAYGEDSPLAVQTAHELWQHGYLSLYVIRGGWDEWLAAGLPTSTGRDR